MLTALRSSTTPPIPSCRYIALSGTTGLARVNCSTSISRQFRRVESNPSYFAFTANEEVTAGNNGDPAQCLPGSNPATVSDMINEDPFPDQSVRLRALLSHMDALYMFSEKQCYPLYGQSVDDFAARPDGNLRLGRRRQICGPVDTERPGFHELRQARIPVSHVSLLDVPGPRRRGAVGAYRDRQTHAQCFCARSLHPLV